MVVGGMSIKFKDGVSESEVKSILQNYNMTRNYRITYDSPTHGENYYIIVNKDKIMDIREIEKEINAHAIIKGDYYIIEVPERAAQFRNFPEMLDKYDLQLKRFVWCDIRFLFKDGPLTYWISKEDAMRIKNELEQNENIFFVRLDYIYSN
jgi:hypothetical protein